MTRTEAIERWSNIASSVFWAEERISKEWHERLKIAPQLTKKAQHDLAEAYCEAIAVEITSKMTDEQLAELP